jgi:uncharacterized protein YbbK (DUF523 family)
VSVFADLHGDPAIADAKADEIRASGKEVVVVSACLLGEKTRYDGRDRLTALPLGDDVELLPLCPEILAGLGCPRPAVQFSGDDRIVDEHGVDRTEAMLAGAERAAALARRAGATRAILKERSPSCGSRQVWRDGQVVPGQGVFAARLRLPVLSEEDC